MLQQKKGIVNITRRKSLSIVIVKIFVPIMKNAFKMHLISANTVALENAQGGLGGRVVVMESHFGKVHLNLSFTGVPLWKIPVKIGLLVSAR